MRKNLIAAMAAVLVVGWTSTAQSIEADNWVVATDALLVVKVRGEPGSFKARGSFDGRVEVEPEAVAFYYNKIAFGYVANTTSQDEAKSKGVTRMFELPAGDLRLDLTRNKAKRAKLVTTSPTSGASVEAVFTSFFDVDFDSALATKARQNPAHWGDPHISERLSTRGKLKLLRQETRLSGNPTVGVRGTFGSGPLEGKQFKARLTLRFIGGQEGED